MTKFVNLAEVDYLKSILNDKFKIVNRSFGDGVTSGTDSIVIEIEDEKLLNRIPSGYADRISFEKFDGYWKASMINSNRSSTASSYLRFGCKSTKFGTLTDLIRCAYMFVKNRYGIDITDHRNPFPFNMV